MIRLAGLMGPLLLLLLSLGSLAGATWLGWHGLDLYFGETAREVEHAGDLLTQNERLEKALLYWSFAVLLMLIAFVAFFALIKGLIDDVSRARRGPIPAGEASPEKDPENAQRKANKNTS